MKLSHRNPLLCFVLLTSLLASFPVRVNAWGPSGHRIVALVAMKHLTPQVRQKIETILGDETLEDVANWADAVRNERRETSGWHFVNLPRNATKFSRTRDCRDASDGEPGCAVTAIEHFRDVLSGAATGDRAEALKFIVHFVGALHQPLHVSFKDDRGGNNIMVTFFGKKSNLHKVWDSGIIGRAGLSDEDYAAELEATLQNQTGNEEVGEMD
ncbi:MAG: S1/P1 nuclease, partial [Acidobacteria bacterium]|nr:S1/P1 nuclease [Acidobacteriota bacterium]